MKLPLMMVAIALLSTSCMAHAHTPHHKAPTIEVTLGWDWVDSRFVRGHWVRGHWHHPHYGKSYRHMRQGPPPRRATAQSVWVAGHWVGRGQHRRWIAGHWR
jgi:hypothetical protein